jgi:hypothetical protein
MRQGTDNLQGGGRGDTRIVSLTGCLSHIQVMERREDQRNTDPDLLYLSEYKHVYLR